MPSPVDLDLIIKKSAELKGREDERDEHHRLAAEADGDVRRMRAELEVLATNYKRDRPSESADDPDDESADESKPITVIDHARDWFKEHPDIVVRAKDVARAGIGKDASAVRSTLHRLVELDFLTQPGMGQFQLKTSAQPQQDGGAADLA